MSGNALLIPEVVALLADVQKCEVLYVESLGRLDVNLRDIPEIGESLTQTEEFTRAGGGRFINFENPDEALRAAHRLYTRNEAVAATGRRFDRVVEFVLADRSGAVRFASRGYSRAAEAIVARCKARSQANDDFQCYLRHGHPGPHSYRLLDV